MLELIDLRALDEVSLHSHLDMSANNIIHIIVKKTFDK